METRITSPRLGVKEIFPFSLFFLFFSHSPAARRNIATTSEYIASLALKEGASNHIVGRETHTIGVYIRPAVEPGRKMFAQPAINNVDGIKCIWRRSQPGHHPAPQTLAKDDFFFGRIEIYFAAKSACLPQRRPENCARAENAWWLDVISPVCNFSSYYESSTMTG